MAKAKSIGWTDYSFLPWGAAGQPRRLLPKQWNRRAEESGKPLKVCCAADLFGDDVEPARRRDAWQMIRDTPHLRWQLPTKHVGNVATMLPDDWHNCSMGVGQAYRHVGVIATVTNQAEANRDLCKLMELKWVHTVRWVGVGCEPLLGPIDLTNVCYRDDDCDMRYNVLTGETWVLNSASPSAYDNIAPKADWVTVGGETGPKARPFNVFQALDIIERCRSAHVPIFMKKLGSNPQVNGAATFQHITGKGKDMSKWPPEFRIQEFPRELLQ